MSDLGVSQTGDARADPVLDGARGVQVGDGNFQVNYHFVYRGDRLTVTDGMNRPPLVDSSGTVESPYRGLGAFSERDAPFFHGREAATREVLGLLSEAAQGSGLLVVSGVSGSGKSSLLRAGVLPRIRGQGLASAPGAARWTGLVLTPTREPLEQLALQAAWLLGTDAAAMHANLAHNPAGFALTARHLALHFAPPGQQSAGRVLLIVDQFEQIFTQCTDDRQRRNFVTALCSAAASGAALVVIVVRADFEARCADFPALAPAVRNQRYLVTAMDEVELRIAIEGPVATLAASTGQPLSVEASLVDYLVREMLEAPGLSASGASGAGALPLLSHALDQSWRSRSGAALTLADYERGGRIQGAVAASADRAFGSLTPSQRDVARQVFLRLTTTGDDGTTARDRVPREELLKAAGPGRDGDVAGVLIAFTAERLITQAAASVEISHDALLTAWPLLRDKWLAGSRVDLTIMSRLRDTARKWAAGGRKPGLLYRDEVLDEAAGAVSRATAAPGQHPALSREEESFLRASVQVRRNAERRRIVIRSGATVLTALLAVAVAVASLALAKAKSDLNAANTQQLSAESTALRDTVPAVSELSAADAWQRARSDQARDVATAAATNPLTAEFDAAVGPVAVSPDGAVLAVGDLSLAVAGPSGRPQLTLWSMTRRELLGDIPLPTGGASSVAFSPVEHGQVATLAATTPAGVVLYQVSGSSKPRELQAPLPAAASVAVAEVPLAFGQGGMLAVSSTVGGSDVWLFAAADGHYPRSPTYIIHGKAAVDSLSFAPDGSLAVGTSSGVSVYPPAGGYTTLRASLSEPADNPATCAQFSSGGLLTVTNGTETGVDRYSRGALSSVPLLANSGPDSSTKMQNCAAGAGNDSATTQGEVEGVAVESAALSSQGVLAVTEGDGLHLYVGNAADGFTDLETLPYPGGQQPFEVDVAFSPDGDALIENIDDQVYLYDTALLIGTWHLTAPITSGQIMADNGLGLFPSGMAFDPADTAFLAIARASAVSLVNVTDGKAIALGDTAGASWVSFAPSGALAVVVSGDLRLFPAPRTDPDVSSVLRAGVSRVVFSPAGAMAVTGPGKDRLTVYPPGKFSAAKGIAPRLPGVAVYDFGLAVDLTFGPSGQLAVATSNGETSTGVAVLAPGTYALQGYIKVPALPAGSTQQAIAFAPDGALAIGTLTDIQVYAPDSYANPKIITGAYNPNLGSYSLLAFTGSGLLVSADQSTGVSLWDYQTGQNLATFALVTDQNDSLGAQLALSPDGKSLAFDSAIDNGADGTEVTTIWSAPYLDGHVADGVRALCDQLGGAPDPDQWQEYFTSALPYPQTCA
jgi:WD40 repeat protein